MKSGEWQELFVYEVKFDMHDVRKASMVTFDMNDAVDIEVTCHYLKDISEVDIRPLSKNITYSQNGNLVLFSLDMPSKLSVEFNGERFRNLHLFANPIEVSRPNINDSNVFVVEPGIHRTEDLLREAEKPNSSDGTIPEIIYFREGMHYIEQTIFKIPSGKTVYLEGGSIVVGS
ncbi:MAG: hypothetical protein ACQEWV_17580 [Bacillota bacterium]